MIVKVDPTKTLPGSTASADEWIAWHQALRARYGKAQANVTFLKAWEKRGSPHARANTTELRAYLEKQGIKVDQSTFGYAADWWDSITGTWSSTLTTARWVGAGAVLILVVALCWVLYNVGKKPELLTKAAGVALL